MTSMKIIRLLTFLLLLASCKKSVDSNPKDYKTKEILPIEINNVTDSNQDTIHQYENSSINSEYYQYTYNVKGLDNLRNKIYGTVRINNSKGIGIIIPTSRFDGYMFHQFPITISNQQ